MLMKSARWITIFFIFCGLLGCAPLPPSAAPTSPPTVPPTQTDTPPSATPLPPTVAPSPTPSVIFETSEFPTLLANIPRDIALGTNNDLIPLGRADTPNRQDIPRHLRINLLVYPGPIITYQGPAIRVFTTLGLENLFPSHVENTRNVINGGPPAFGIYPAIPIISGATQLQIRMKPLGFQAGKGFRYLEYENTPSLDNLQNQYMNYVYQGISADGKYYVSVIMPVTMPFLKDVISQVATQAATMTTPLPTQLLLLPILQQLQSADDAAFNPSLAVLDDIVASLDLKP